jgi:hypothetical protein
LALLAIAPAAQAEDWSLLDASTPIADPAADDSSRVEVGVKFRVALPASGDYWVEKVRFYRAPAHGMVENRVFVYDDSGAEVARGVAIGEGPRSGVVEVQLNSALKLRPGVTYTASYLADGYYADQQHGFEAARTVGPVTFPANAGVYKYGGGFPTSSWQASGYYVSPVVTLRAAAPAPEPPPAPAAGPFALFDSSTTVPGVPSDDAGRVSLGVKFRVAAPSTGDYWVEKVRFYRHRNTGMVENHVRVFDENGAEVARGAAIGEGGRDGWVDVILGTPAKLRPNVTYTASYFADGHYPEQLNGFDAARTAGPVTFPENAGVYAYGGDFPAETWEGTNYYVTPVVSWRGPAAPAPPEVLGGPWSLVDTAPQYHQSVDEPYDVELGVKFSVPTASSSGDYWVDAVEFWQEKGMKTNRVWVYDDTGAIVAQGIKTAAEPLTGKVRVALDAALKLRTGVAYTASYHSDGAYLALGGVFAPNITHGPLRFPQNAGVYRYGGGAGFPVASWAAASYYVSPVVMLRSR